jgi:uncharacterized protein YjdB
MLQKQRAELCAKLAGDEALLQQLEADLFDARGNAATQKCLLKLVWANPAAADQQVKQQTHVQQKHWWQGKASQQKKALQAGKAEAVQLQGQRQRLQADLLKLNRQVRQVAWLRANYGNLKFMGSHWPSMHDYDTETF